MRELCTHLTNIAQKGVFPEEMAQAFKDIDVRTMGNEYGSAEEEEKRQADDDSTVKKAQAAIEGNVVCKYGVFSFSFPPSDSKNIVRCSLLRNTEWRFMDFSGN